MEITFLNFEIFSAEVYKKTCFVVKNGSHNFHLMFFSAQNPPKNVETVSEHEWQRAARSEENRLKQCFSTWGSQEDFLAVDFSCIAIV